MTLVQFQRLLKRKKRWRKRRGHQNEIYPSTTLYMHVYIYTDTNIYILTFITENQYFIRNRVNTKKIT